MAYLYFFFTGRPPSTGGSKRKSLMKFLKMISKKIDRENHEFTNKNTTRLRKQPFIRNPLLTPKISGNCFIKSFTLEHLFFRWNL